MSALKYRMISHSQINLQVAKYIQLTCFHRLGHYSTQCFTYFYYLQGFIFYFLTFELKVSSQSACYEYLFCHVSLANSSEEVLVLLKFDAFPWSHYSFHSRWMIDRGSLNGPDKLPPAPRESKNKSY